LFLVACASGTSSAGLQESARATATSQAHATQTALAQPVQVQLDIHQQGDIATNGYKLDILVTTTNHTADTIYLARLACWTDLIDTELHDPATDALLWRHSLGMVCAGPVGCATTQIVGIVTDQAIAPGASFTWTLHADLSINGVVGHTLVINTPYTLRTIVRWVPVPCAVRSPRDATTALPLHEISVASSLTLR